MGFLRYLDEPLCEGLTLGETLADTQAELAFDEVLDRLSGDLVEWPGWITNDEDLPPMMDQPEKVEPLGELLRFSLREIAHSGQYTVSGKDCIEEWLRSVGVDPKGLPPAHDGKPGWVHELESSGHSPRDFCHQGHRLTPENVQETTRGRTCRTCYLAWRREYERSRRANGLVKSRAKVPTFRPCLDCGGDIGHKRSDSLYCNQTCRKRHNRRRAA